MSNFSNYRDREFIDFNFDGKNITEFGLVAAISGDRYQMALTNEFSDETSEVNGIDGQYYWFTQQKPREFKFQLATDGMTDKQLRRFKYHFQPGKYGKLIMPESENIYYDVRVSQKIVLEFIPFEENGKRVYKGEIEINFIADDPYGYAIDNVLSKADNVYGIPDIHSLAESNLNYNYIHCGLNNGYVLGNNQYLEVTDELNTTILYNPSEVPSKYIISFTSTYNYSIVEGIYYLNNFADDFNSSVPYNTIELFNSFSPAPISTFKYGSPNLIYNVNYAISIAAQYFIDASDGPVTTFEEKLRESILEPKVMAWAAYCIRQMKQLDYVKGDCFDNNARSTLYFANETISNATWNIYFSLMMISIFRSISPEIEAPSVHNRNDFGDFYSYTISFNGKNGTSYITTDFNNDGIIVSKNNFKEKNCSEVAYNGYLLIDGGLELSDDNKITDYYLLKFSNPLYNDNTFKVSNLKIEYNYTFI